MEIIFFSIMAVRQWGECFAWFDWKQSKPTVNVVWMKNFSQLQVTTSLSQFIVEIINWIRSNN